MLCFVDLMLCRYYYVCSMRTAARGRAMPARVTTSAESCGPASHACANSDQRDVARPGDHPAIRVFDVLSVVRAGACVCHSLRSSGSSIGHPGRSPGNAVRPWRQNRAQVLPMSNHRTKSLHGNNDGDANAELTARDVPSPPCMLCGRIYELPRHTTEVLRDTVRLAQPLRS